MNDKYTKIFWFLKAIPHLQYTAKSVSKVANRLGIEPEHLLRLIDFIIRESRRRNGK